MKSVIIKHVGPWALIKTRETRYFKNGRPNLHIRTSYQVEYQATDIKTLGIVDVPGNCYNIPTLKEAKEKFNFALKISKDAKELVEEYNRNNPPCPVYNMSDYKKAA